MNRVMMVGAPYPGWKGMEAPENSVVQAPNAKGQVVPHFDAKNMFKFGSKIDISWLPFAAPTYHISPNISDYVFTYVPALTSDIPNRNMQGFPLQSLLEFNPELGCQRYKTFVGKPLQEEHQNKDVTKAKGVIFDASIVAVPKYKVAKVMLLVGADRTKDPRIASAIKKNGGSFSMGSWASILKCSICGGVDGPKIRRSCTCYHSIYSDLSTYGSVRDGKLHYMLGMDPEFFEISYVRDPADPTAYGDLI